MPCHDPKPRCEIHGHQIAIRVACEFLTACDQNHIAIPEYALKWWNDHKIMDADIKRREESKNLPVMDKAMPEENKE